MILRLSQKLNTKLKAGTLKAKPLDENPYADWSCHLFTFDRTQYILVSNTASLYSSVMYGSGITDDCIFITRAMSCLREFMEQDGQAFIYQKLIAPTAKTVTFAKALNRSVIGSMNELIAEATYRLANEEISPFELGFGLNDILLSAIPGKNSDKYGRPNEAFRLLAERYRPATANNIVS